MTVRTPDAPEPEETPAPLASEPIDKLLAEWSHKVHAEGPPEVTFSGYFAAYALDRGRAMGLDARQLVTELGRRLTEAAKALGKPPFGEADIARFAEELDADDESIPRPPA